MNNIVFFDTETTGNTEKDFLCQVAYRAGDESFTGLYKPPIKISPEASAVHHITNKMVEEKPAFSQSGDQPKIKQLLENGDSVLVAHNAPFDLMILKKEDIVPKNFICTLRLARHLDPEEKIEKYNLQYLRYFLDIEIDATAHSALGDVLVLEKLYERLKKKFMESENLDEKEALQKMMGVSSHPTLFTSIKFGKYTGRKMAEVVKSDRRYLEWLLAEKLNSGKMEEDWIYTLKHYLNR